MAAIITYGGNSMAGLQPLVSISTQNPIGGEQGTQRIKLEGIIPCGDSSSISDISNIVAQNFEELLIEDTEGGEVASWQCAKVIGYSVGGGSEVLGTPYSIEFEAYDSLTSLATNHGVTDVVSDSSYSSNGSNPTATVTISCRGIKVCDEDGGGDLTDPFTNARKYIESQGVTLPSQGEDGVVGQTNYFVDTDSDPDDGTNTSAGNCTNASISFDRVRATYSMTKTFDLGVGSEITTTTNWDAKEGESTSINGRIKGYGDPGASLSAALGVVGGSIRNNVSIDHDAIWGETSISSNGGATGESGTAPLGLTGEDAIQVDYNVTATESASDGLISVTCSIYPTFLSDVRPQWKHIKKKMEAAGTFTYATEAFDLLVGEDYAGRPLKADPVSSSESINPATLTYSKSDTYNTRSQIYAGGKNPSSSFTYRAAVPKISEIQGSNTVEIDLGYNTLASFSASASATCGAGISAEDMFPLYTQVRGNNTCATTTSATSTTSNQGDSSSNYSETTTFDSAHAAVARNDDGTYELQDLVPYGIDEGGDE